MQLRPDSGGWGPASSSAIVLGGLLLATMMTLHASESRADVCTANWQETIEGDGRMAPGFSGPDSNYRNYPWDNDAANAQIALRITGVWPYARYRSYVLNDDNLNLIDSLHDVDVVPEPGQVNVFQPNVDRDSPNREHVIWVRPAGSAHIGDHPNTLVVDNATPRTVLIMRTYRPDDGLDNKGGVPLPTIEAFDDATGAPAACPDVSLGLGDLSQAEFVRPDDFPLMPDLRSYNMAGSGWSPNGNPYLGVPLWDSDELGDVAVVKIRMPSYPDTAQGGGVFTGLEEVRYFNICLVSVTTTASQSCIRDDQMVVHPDGFVRIAVGPWWLRRKAESMGFGFFRWGAVYNPAFMTRQIQPGEDFPGNHNLVPLFDVDGDILTQLETKAADLFVGDYGAVGHYCSTADFRRNGCGL